MTRGRTIAVALGIALALAAIALLALRARPEPTEGTPAANAAAQDTRERSQPASATSTGAQRAGERASHAARDAGTSDVVRVLRATDEHDRALLAGIERQTKASPPEAVHELIELRRRGATRDELQAFIDRELSGRLPVRVAAQRWLRAVRPRPGLESAPAPPPRMGSGGGPKLLQPIEPAQPR